MSIYQSLISISAEILLKKSVPINGQTRQRKSSSYSQSICLVLSPHQNPTYTVNSPNNQWKIHVKGRMLGEDSRFASDDENRKVVLVRFQGCGLRKI